MLLEKWNFYFLNVSLFIDSISVRLWREANLNALWSDLLLNGLAWACEHYIYL